MIFSVRFTVRDNNKSSQTFDCVMHGETSAEIKSIIAGVFDDDVTIDEITPVEKDKQENIRLAMGIAERAKARQRANNKTEG